MSERIASKSGTDAVQARYEIVVHENGSLQILGPIENKEYTMAVLDQAKQAVKDYHGRKGILVPGKDVSL